MENNLPLTWTWWIYFRDSNTWCR